jgi:caa(3)-type oxidase subunit IV
MKTKVPPKYVFLAIWLLLVALHFAILGTAYFLQFGVTPVIAVFVLVQMILIILFFMEVRHSAKLTWFFVSAGFFWLLIQFVLVASDYLTRIWH